MIQWMGYVNNELAHKITHGLYLGIGGALTRSYENSQGYPARAAPRAYGVGREKIVFSY